MKNVLILMTSPRKGKNTDNLSKAIIRGIDNKKFNIDKIDLADYEINHCRACDYCGKTGECIIDDDMQEIYKLIDQCHILILASPVYFNTINSLGKSLIDRCQKYWSIKYSLNDNYKRGEDRRGILLAVGGAKYNPNQFLGLYPPIDYFFRAVNVKHIGSYFVSNTDNIDVLERPDLIEDMKEIGKNLNTIKHFTIQI